MYLSTSSSPSILSTYLPYFASLSGTELISIPFSSFLYFLFVVVKVPLKGRLLPFLNILRGLKLLITYPYILCHCYTFHNYYYHSTYQSSTMDRLTKTTLLLFAILFSSATALNNAFGSQSLSNLLPRQETCGSDTNSVTCNVGSFCCPSNTRCIPVENATSVVCCKVGEICDEIFPITCSTTTLSTLSTQPKLDTCGTQCCPVGYECGPNKDRCIMKAANLPADYVENREGRKNANLTNEALLETCKQFITLPATSDEIPVSRCPKFTWEGILVGLFPGIAIGLAIMLVYIKAVEIKTRRRTIHFNGRLSAMPEDFEEQKLPPPPVPVIGADVRERYSSNFFSANNNPMIVNPTPALTNEWKPRDMTNEWKPRNFSGSSNPILEGRGSAMSRSTNASSTNSRSPAPYPLTPAPKPAPAPYTISRTSAPYIPSPEPSAYNPGPGSREVSSVSSATASDFSAAVTKALRGGNRPELDEFTEPMKARVMDVNRPLSLETGYTASFYQGGEGLCHPPFVDEEEVPPLRFKGGLQPVGLTGRGLGWDDNRF